MHIVRTGKRYRALVAASHGLAAKAKACRAIFYHTVLRHSVLYGSKVSQVEAHGYTFEIDLGRKELAGVLEVLLERGYELKGRWVTRPGDTVFDIGSNVGVFAVMQGKQAEPGKVYAFEPSPTAYGRLTRNVAFNNVKNVETFPYALGDRSATSKFIESPISLNSRLTDGQTDAPTVDVTVTTLDEFVAAQNVKRIDLMKVDTEGHEIPVLTGGRSALRMTRRLVLETHRARDGAPIQAMLEAAGFALVHREGDLWFFERKHAAR